MRTNRGNAEIGIDTMFKRTLKMKNSGDDLSFMWQRGLMYGYLMGICDLGVITEDEYEFLNKCVGEINEIIE